MYVIQLIKINLEGNWTNKKYVDESWKNVTKTKYMLSHMQNTKSIKHLRIEAAKK